MKYALLITLTLLAFQASSASSSKDDHPQAILSLDVFVYENQLHVLTAAYNETDQRNQLHHRVSTDEGQTWSSPIRVDEGQAEPHARGRGTDFHLAVAKDAITAVWLTKGGGFGQRGPLVAAHSADGGKTWYPSANPADDGTDGDHAFIDVASTPNGNFHAVWLDTRVKEGKGLIASRSEDQGQTWRPNTIIDAQTCQCCWNILQSDATGTLYALYRDLNPRDMAMALSYDDGRSWTRLSTVGPFDWQFKGCPHVGGALAIENAGPDAKLHTLVWTGKEGKTGLYYQKAAAPDFNWSPSRKIGSSYAKYADIAIDSHDRLLAVWTENAPQGAQLMYSKSNDGGINWIFPTPIASPGAKPSHPRTLSLNNCFHLFWTSSQGLEHLKID